jgi:hypothetical protein
MQDDLTRAPRFPWGDFPDVLRNGNLGELKQQPEYMAAKSGESEAALNLASRIIRPEFEAAVAKFGSSHPRPVLLPVLAEESVGDNRIPLAFAEVLSERLGWQVERDVLQINRAWHTDAGADHRLIARCLFDGIVEPDAGYILIDDTLTIGGTLADLRGFIMSKGAAVLGATIVVAHEGALHLPIRDKMRQDIFVKYGKDVVQEFSHEEFGYGIECLTQGEAGHIRKAPSLDALRGRFTQARDALGQRVDARGATPPSHRQRADKREEPLALPNLHPPPDTLSRNDFLVETISRGGHVMAAQLDHLLSYGPLDVVASNEEKNPGLHIVNVDAESRAFIPQDDPLHKEIRALIEKNPHSLGFAANQINARLEQDGRWQGPAREAEGLSFGPSLSMEVEVPGTVPSFEMETFPAQKVDLPDGMKTALNPRVELRPLVIREGSRITPKDMEPGDHLVGYVVKGRTDPLPGADEMEHNLFPGKGQQSFSVEELDKARDAAQAMAGDTAIDFATLEAGYKERAGREFGSGRYFQRGHMESGMDRWQEQKAQHFARETPEVAAAEPEKPEIAEAGKLGNEAAVVQERPAPKQTVDHGKDPLANWPVLPQKTSVFPEPESPEKPKFERKTPPEVLFANPKGKPYVLDHGDKVTVTNRAMLGLGSEAAAKRQKAVEVGLKTAVDRFGEPVRFHGSRAFMEETVKVAMERGIKLEPGSPMAKEIYERATREHGNQLGPSKAAPYRAPEKKREVGKDKGLGL